MNERYFLLCAKYRESNILVQRSYGFAFAVTYACDRMGDIIDPDVNEHHLEHVLRYTWMIEPVDVERIEENYSRRRLYDNADISPPNRRLAVKETLACVIATDYTVPRDRQKTIMGERGRRRGRVMRGETTVSLWVGNKFAQGRGDPARWMRSSVGGCEMSHRIAIDRGRCAPPAYA